MGIGPQNPKKTCRKYYFKVAAEKTRNEALLTENKIFFFLLSYKCFNPCCMNQKYYK
jgi:hypothetical protein